MKYNEFIYARNYDNKFHEINNARDIQQFVLDLSPEQIVDFWSEDNDDSNRMFRLTVKEINEILDCQGVLDDTTLMEFFKHTLPDRALSNMLHWYKYSCYSLEVISAEQVQREEKYGQAAEEIDALLEADITGPYFYREDFGGYPEDLVFYKRQVIQITPDEIIKLAEKIKAFRAEKAIAVIK